jgi:hypothetical protein
MSAVTESDLREIAVVRSPVLIAVAQIAGYLSVVAIALFVVSTGVSPIIPAGMAVVATVAMLRVVKRLIVSFFADKKASLT